MVYIINNLCEATSYFFSIYADPPTITAVGPDRLTTALLYSGASFECHADAMPPADYR